jgi:hypothetical protein
METFNSILVKIEGKYLQFKNGLRLENRSTLNNFKIGDEYQITYSKTNLHILEIKNMQN